jgi:4-amino-4-deoxy-L-arabinose transferase-like glycosyltransferase
MLFGSFFVLSIYFGAQTLLRGAGTNKILWAYVFMALATLAKGLIGLVLPALLFIAAMLTYRDWSMFRRARPVLGVLIFLSITAPWFFLVNKATAGRWLSEFVYVHHFLRYTDSTGHRRPFYYYLTTLPSDFLPWTILAVPAAITSTCREKLRHPHAQFCLVWFLTIFVFFSLSDSKRELYLLPLMPTLALLVGNYVEGVSSGRLNVGALPRYVMAGLFGMIAMAGFAAPVIAWFRWPDAVWPIIPLSLVLVCGGILTGLSILRGRMFAAFALLSGMMLAVTFAAILWALPYLERYKSDREFAQEIVRIVPPQAQLYVYRDSTHDFNFYTKREEIPVLKSADQIAGLRDQQNSYVLITEREWKRTLGLLPEWSIAASNGLDWRLIRHRPSRDRGS